jgi:hypothetical protein
MNYILNMEMQCIAYLHVTPVLYFNKPNQLDDTLWRSEMELN